SSFLTATSTTAIYTLSLHDAVPIFFHTSVVSQMNDFYAGSLNHSAHNVDRSIVTVKKRSCRYDTNGIFGFVNIFANIEFFFLYRSEEHTSELQSRENLVCRLLLEKK